jgi:hypothetical protein
MKDHKCECVAIPNEGHTMLGFWKKVFPSGEIPIKPIRFKGVVVSSKAGVVKDLFWALDKSRCDAGQQYLISQYLAEAFGVSVESIAQDFQNETKQIPVRDRDITLAFCPYHSRILMSS